GNTDSALNNVTIAAGTTVSAAFGELDLAGTIINYGELDASGAGKLDLENVSLTGGTLGGKGTIGTATGNIHSTVKKEPHAAGTTVTAAVGELVLIGTITNNGALDASGIGKIDLENVTIDGGTLGGNGTIATVSGWNTLNGITIENNTTLKVTDNTALELEGTIANLGIIALNSSGHSTQ